MASEALRDLYQQVIRDHSRQPRNQGKLEGPCCCHAHAVNPACGDEVEVWVQSGADGQIEDIRFQGQGCAISQASASLMTESVKGRDRAQLASLLADFRSLVTGEGVALNDAALGDLHALEGVRQFPQRIPCALLAWRALEEALGRPK